MTISIRPLLIAALVTIAIAAPLPKPDTSDIESGVDINANDLEEGICKPVTLIFARGSIELGNMGFAIGPQLCTNLKTTLGADNVACQGVGGGYTADLIPNLLPENTNQESIDAGVDMFELANKCPDTQIVAGGYSQGTAVISGAIQDITDAALREKVKGVVLFGFTRNKQDGGRIPGYDVDRTKVFCADGDLVCDGTLLITIAHFSYGQDVGSAADFLAGKVSV